MFAAPRGEGTFVAWGDLVLQIQRTYGFRISGEPISAAIARLLDQGELREEHTTREHIRLVGLTPTGRQRRDNLESTTPMRDTA
ncbi:hypothetical protein [Algisphaera agarilytica]|uniref:Uncharacterized protein n=1 Tax=Algisphaera agarilytica TaxID=1385975 RepID=A0A7X0H539_9BACT|nr:hypothetical protein [Algisphaera agarilytica]MBB6429202.1 hypothetical protein [Algisphaera agarilytica]